MTEDPPKDVPPEVWEKARAKVAEQNRREMLEAMQPFVGLAEKLGRYAVPMSVLFYALGFVIAGMHFLPRGVPLQALNHAQFIGAALLFGALTQTALLEGYYLARAFSWLAVFALLSITVAMTGWLGQLGTTSFWPAAYFAFVCVASYVWRGLTNKYPRLTRKTGTPYDVIFAPLSVLVMLLWLFTTYVYPNTPQWLGGGLPRPVAISWEKDDPIQDLTGPNTCRQEFAVLEDKDFLYLAIAEWPEPKSGCPEPTKTKPRTRALVGKWPDRRDTHLLYTVVPRSSVSRLVYE